MAFAHAIALSVAPRRRDTLTVASPGLLKTRDPRSGSFPSRVLREASPLKSGGQGGSVPAAAITKPSRNRKCRIVHLEIRQHRPLFNSPGAGGVKGVTRQ